MTYSEVNIKHRDFHLPLEYQYPEQVSHRHRHHSLSSFFCSEHSELNSYDNHKCKDALPETKQIHTDYYSTRYLRISPYTWCTQLLKNSQSSLW